MILSKRVALAIAGVAAAAVVGTAGVAAATAPDPSPAPTAPSARDSGSAAPGRAAERREKIRHRLLGRGMHGEWVVKGKDGKPVTVASVRGEVTAVSATSITFKAEDGFTATYAITADTKVRGQDVDKITDVEVGDKGGAVGTRSGSTLTARAVLVRK
jgi:siroheme synthase